MAKYVCLLLKTKDDEVRVKADKIEQDRTGGVWLLSEGGQNVGLFLANEVQGWYIIDEPD